MSTNKEMLRDKKFENTVSNNLIEKDEGIEACGIIILKLVLS